MWVKSLCRCVKLRVLRYGGYPELSVWFLNAITNILIRERQREIIQTNRGESHVETEQRQIWLQGNECRQPPEGKGARERILSQSFQIEHGPADTDFGLLFPEL